MTKYLVCFAVLALVILVTAPPVPTEFLSFTHPEEDAEMIRSVLSVY